MQNSNYMHEFVLYFKLCAVGTLFRKRSFAKTQTCHINDGIFGEQKYREYQFVYEIKVIGNLIVLITAAHRIITCIKQARANEKSSDWKGISEVIENCDKVFDNKLRNYMEHLEEKIYKEELSNQNCYFSPQRILYCNDEKTNKEFDFTNDKLQIIDKLIDGVLEMLSKREKDLFSESAD